MSGGVQSAQLIQRQRHRQGYGVMNDAVKLCHDAHAGPVERWQESDNVLAL